MICFTELPAKLPPSRQSSPGQRVLLSNPSVRWPVPVYALHAPTKPLLLSPRMPTYIHTFIHSFIHVYIYTCIDTNTPPTHIYRHASTNEYLCIYILRMRITLLMATHRHQKVVDKNEHEGSAQNGILNPNRSRLGWLGWENELRVVSANGEGRR